MRMTRTIKKNNLIRSKKLKIYWKTSTSTRGTLSKKGRGYGRKTKTWPAAAIRTEDAEDDANWIVSLLNYVCLLKKYYRFNWSNFIVFVIILL